MTAQLDGIRAKVQVFQAMERDFESYQKSVRLVMQQGNRLSGIHGPVSRLIRTEDEYTSAIEIALGGAMQQIVVDTEQDGKAAISFLKRTGRRTGHVPAVICYPGQEPDGKGPGAVLGLCGNRFQIGQLSGPIPGHRGKSAGPYRHCGGYGRRHCHGPDPIRTGLKS